jgi:hypothetical protein
MKLPGKTSSPFDGMNCPLRHEQTSTEGFITIAHKVDLPSMRSKQKFLQRGSKASMRHRSFSISINYTKKSKNRDPNGGANSFLDDARFTWGSRTPLGPLLPELNEVWPRAANY